jgi:phenylacetyl-CoA:acceptor oxidoreductase 27-kDa subunit
MTRWAMVADLNRCVGCQTCTTACKHANATVPGVQWRRVLDIEAGAVSRCPPRLRARRLHALR